MMSPAVCVVINRIARPMRKGRAFFFEKKVCCLTARTGPCHLYDAERLPTFLFVCDNNAGGHTSFFFFFEVDIACSTAISSKDYTTTKYFFRPFS